jgi:hypothetical protein
MKCPECGAEMPPNAKFCGKCGTKLPEVLAISIFKTDFLVLDNNFWKNLKSSLKKDDETNVYQTIKYVGRLQRLLKNLCEIPRLDTRARKCVTGWLEKLQVARRKVDIYLKKYVDKLPDNAEDAWDKEQHREAEKIKREVLPACRELIDTSRKAQDDVRRILPKVGPHAYLK